MSTKPIIFGTPTLAEALGLATIREGLDALATVTQLHVKGDTIPGDHERHHQDQDANRATCSCDSITAALAGIPCPRHLPKQYATFGAEHRSDRA